MCPIQLLWRAGKRFLRAFLYLTNVLYIGLTNVLYIGLGGEGMHRCHVLGGFRSVGGRGGGGGSSRPATQPPSHPATQPPSHPATLSPSHPTV